MSRGMLFMVGIAIGGALGAGIVMLCSESEPRGVSPLEADRPEDPTPSEPAPGLRGQRPDVDEAEPRAAVVEPGDVHLTKAAFLRAFAERFKQQTGAEADAAQAEAAWERLQLNVEHAAAGSGAQAAGIWRESRRKAEISERDDIMALLEDKEREADVTALRNDAAAFVRLLQHKTAPLHVDGERHLTGETSEPLKDGTVLGFPAGVFRLSEQALMGRGYPRAMPRDLTVEGAGMNRTLITLSDFGVRDLVYNLHLKDCTIDCGNDGAFDLRSMKASVFAENVRFVRFDAGHGGCTIFSLRGGAVYCRNCRFDGGYGKSPGGGHILRGVTVARFDDCVFDRIRYPIGRHAPATFAGCTFQDCQPMESEIKQALLSANTRRARFEDCRVVSTLEADEKTKRLELKRDLKVLFPTFRGR